MNTNTDKTYNILEIKEFPEETLFVGESDASNEVTFKASDGLFYAKFKGSNVWNKCYLTKKWLNTKFKIYKVERKVECLEAFKAFEEGKTIKVKYKNFAEKEEDIISIYKPRYYEGDYLFDNESAITPYTLLHGEWYIVDCCPPDEVNIE